MEIGRRSFMSSVAALFGMGALPMQKWAEGCVESQALSGWPPPTPAAIFSVTFWACPTGSTEWTFICFQIGDGGYWVHEVGPHLGIPINMNPSLDDLLHRKIWDGKVQCIAYWDHCLTVWERMRICNTNAIEMPKVDGLIAWWGMSEAKIGGE